MIRAHALDYWHRHHDMFGNLDIGTMPAGRTSTTGSLKGIEDGFLKLDYRIDERIIAVFIHEKVAVHDNSAIISTPTTTSARPWASITSWRPTWSSGSVTTGWRTM